MKTKRLPYEQEARSDARAEMPRFIRGGLVVGLLAFLLPAAVAVGVYYCAQLAPPPASQTPDADEIAPIARDARDLALIISGVVGLAAGIIVTVRRYQGFLRHATAVHKIQESEGLFRSTYETSPVGMYLTDIDGRIMRANRAFVHFLGFDESELLKLPPYTLTAKENLSANRQIEQAYQHRDGRTLWGLASTTVVTASHDGTFLYLTQVVDVTERKKMEATLRMSEERVVFAADTGRVGIWDYDIRMGTVVWNDVMHTIHRTDPATFSKKFETQLSFIVPEDAEGFMEAFSKSMKEGRPFSREYRIGFEDGKVRHLQTRAQFIRDKTGRSARAVGTVIDISEAKAEAEELIRTREAALAADKAKSEFLAMMSHEIRTPLNGVLGFASILKGTPLNQEQLGYLETMEASGERLIALVNDILDLSKIEAGEIKIEPSTFAIRPFLQKVHEVFRARALEKNLQYEVFIKQSLPETIHTDPQRLGQILINLLSNAVKFTAQGHVHLRVKASQQDGEWVWRFAVEDTGPGIPPEALPKLFHAFYQVDSSNTRKHGGTGLGLAISRRFAKRLNGHMEVRSELEAGSEFTLVLPAPGGTLADMEANGADNASPSNRLQGKRVLVVEDNAVNRRLCGLQLKRLGCVTEFAETGTEAVKKIREGNYDAVLMDIQLPDLDGYDVTREVRAGEKNGRVPIIALTANAMPEDKARCTAAGMDDFLSKPLQQELLAQALSRWA